MAKKRRYRRSHILHQDWYCAINPWRAFEFVPVNDEVGEAEQEKSAQEPNRSSSVNEKCIT